MRGYLQKQAKTYLSVFLASLPRRPQHISSIRAPHSFLISKGGSWSFCFHPVKNRIAHLSMPNENPRISNRGFNPNNELGHTPCKDGHQNTQDSSAGSSLPIFSTCPWKITNQLLRKWRRSLPLRSCPKPLLTAREIFRQ